MSGAIFPRHDASTEVVLELRRLTDPSRTRLYRANPAARAEAKAKIWVVVDAGVGDADEHALSFARALAEGTCKEASVEFLKWHRSLTKQPKRGARK